jgi:hypothetical protein
LPVRESFPVEEFDRVDGYVGKVLAGPGIVDDTR